jgi:hypothetical protein
MQYVQDILGHLLGPGRVRSSQEKARHRKRRPRPGPARLSGLKNLSRPGPSEVFLVGPSGFRVGPSQKLPKILPKPSPSQQLGRVSTVQARPSGQKMWPRPEIFGPGCPCSGLVHDTVWTLAVHVMEYTRLGLSGIGYSQLLITPPIFNLVL